MSIMVITGTMAGACLGSWALLKAGRKRHAHLTLTLVKFVWILKNYPVIYREFLLSHYKDPGFLPTSIME